MDGGPIPEIRFASARGARLAYQVLGHGPWLVAVPPTAQNIEMAWERPEIRAMFERFGSFCRFLQFDKRGTGSSDRRSVMPGLDERVDDLRAVMDDAGVERTHLYAASEGGPMAILFAATYPDRVEGLILHGAWARYPATTTGATRQEMIEGADAFARVWGTADSPMVDGFAPSLAGDAGFREWHQRYERRAASADAIRDLLHLMIDFDVTDVLPSLEVPTLVLHRTGDRIVPIELAREIAAAVPGARLVEQDGADHFGYAGELDPWMDEVERFVTGSVGARPSDPPARSDVRITTLGRFAVEVDGVEVPTSAWGSRRARTLCKRLVVARGWPVTRDELIELLWPDDPDPHRLGARLSVQLSAVRRVLRGGVVADRETVRLDLDEVATDLQELASADDDDTIVAAYTGELLPEDRYDDWTIGPREEARSRFTTAARRLAVSHLADGSGGEATALARRLVAADRHDDDAHRLLVLAHRSLGEEAEARRAHAEWVVALGELGIDVPPLDDVT